MKQRIRFFCLTLLVMVAGMAAAQDVVEISTVDQLKAFRDAVNSGNTYVGKTVKLTADLDLSGESNWTPIGNLVAYPSQSFNGTFDGDGHSISNVTVNDNTPDHAVAGLFGSVVNGTIKNLTVKDVNITSTHYAAGIVAYTSNGPTIENCHVIGGTIKSTPELLNGSYDNGDKVGGIMGYATAGSTINNCTVEGVTISGYRDLGGIVGFSNGTVTNNTAINVTVTQDTKNGYKNPTPTTIGDIIGQKGGSATLSNNKVIKGEPVAKIGEEKYYSLADAVAAAQQMGGAVTVELIDDISGETVTINEVANFKLTIDGKKDESSNYTVDAVIVVDGLRGNTTLNGSTTNGASVTLQNIAFVKTTATDGIQASHYAHHLTIQDCTYSGSDNDKWFLNASVDGPLYGVTVKNVTVEHARLIYANMADDAVFQNITATTDCKVGFNVKTSGTALIENCQVTTGKYAFRDYTDGYAGTFTLKGNTFISTSEDSDEGAIVNRGGAVGTAHINVESGTYTGHLRVLNNKEGVLAISGGYFSEEFPQEYIAANLVAQGKVCTPATDMEGYFTVGDPHYVAQIGENKYVTLQAAFEAAEANDKIELIDDAPVDGTGTVITVDKVLTLELKGHKVINNATAGRPFTIAQGGNLTIDGTAEGSGFEIPSENTNSNGLFRIDGEESVLTINGGSFIGNTDNGAFFRVGDNAGATVNLNNLSAETNYRFVACGNYTWSELNVTGGTYIHNNKDVRSNNAVVPAFYLAGFESVFDGVTITSQIGSCVGVTGYKPYTKGTFRNNIFKVEETSTDQSWNNVALSVDTNGEVIVESGTYEGSRYGLYIFTSGGDVTINGGTFKGATASIMSSFDDNTYGQYEWSSKATITDGFFNGPLSTNNSENATISVSGGVFTVPVPEQYCAEGYIPAFNTDEATKEAYPYTVKTGAYVAQIVGGAKYETLQAAVDAAEEGATIDILKDFTLTTVTTSPSARYNVNIDKSVTINGNNHVITGSEGKRSIILMGEGNNITLKDLTLKNNKSEACLWIGDAVNATLDNVTLDGTNGIAYNQPLTISQFESENRVTLNITNGSVIKTNDAGTAHYSIIAWHPADITVTDSKLVGWANVYLKPDAAGSTVKIEDSEMKSQGLSGSSNSFAIIVTEGDGNTIELKDTEIEGAAVEGTYQSLFRLGGQGNVLKFLGSTTYETNDMTWGCATYEPGAVFNNKVYFDVDTKAAFAKYFTAEDGPTISAEMESPINLYPLLYSPEVYYYWIADGKEDGGYYDLADPFTNGWLDNGEFIRLIKDVELESNLTWAKKNASFTMTFGDYKVTKGEYSIALKQGVTVNTDKQTDIFTAVDADYKVMETAVEGGYTYTVVAKEYVAQIGDVKYETLAEAVAAVPADGSETTIEMIANEMIDVVGSAITIPANKNVVIDLNGFQVVGTAAGGSTSALITNKGTLTIKDSSDTNKDGTGTGQLISGATTTWIYEGDGNYAGSYASNTITNSGTLTIESGYIENLSTGSATYAVDNNSSGGNAILNVNGGLLKARSVAVRQFANSTTLKNEVNIAGGTVTAGYSGIWIQLPGSDATKAVKATLNVTGGTLNGGSYAFYDYSYGNLYDATQYNLSGGTFNGDIFSYGANINITDGTYNGEVAIKQAKPSIIAVSGGKFAGDVYTYGDNASEGFITGGVYAINTYEYQGETYDCDWLYLLAEGYVAVDNTDEATMAQYPYTVKSKEEAGLFDLIDGEPYERTADVQAKKVTYTRTFPYQVSGSLQCWVVPFDYTITEEDLQNLSFYKTHLISAVESATGGMVEDDNKIYLYYQPVEAGTVLKANKPYFVKVNEKTTENKTFTFAAENVKLKAKNDDRLLNVSTSRFNFDFYAAYVSGFKPEAEHWLGVNQYGSLFWNKPTSKLASSYRWYIEVTDNEDDYAKITFELIEESDATTTIENGSVDSNADIEGFYTVGGVKLNTPAKGLNIVKYTDGTTKKVYIKK